MNTTYTITAVVTAWAITIGTSVLTVQAASPTDLGDDPDIGEFTRLDTGETTASDAELFALALDDLQSGRFPEALKGFSQIKAKYPYSKYAPLADVRTADAHFERAKFAEAIDEYRNFLKFNPRHSESPYVMFRIAEAFFAQIPTDWWIMPPAAEKEQAQTQRAITAYNDLLAAHPQSPLAAKAEERLRTCNRKLADHEMYVAKFYFDGGHYKAASMRAMGLLEKYPDVGLGPEALWIAARSFEHEGNFEKATQAAQQITKQFPNSPQRPQAAGMLDRLRQRVSAAAKNHATKGRN